MKRKLLQFTIRYFPLGLLLFLASCSKNDFNQAISNPESSIVFKTFTIESKNNPLVQNDINFKIKGDTIYGNLYTFQHNIIPTFTSNAAKITIGNVTQSSGATVIDFKNPVIYSLFSPDNKKHDYYVKINWNDSLPLLTINTDGGVPIISKDDYVHANITIDGKNIFSSYNGTTKIKGRGNSTWFYPKKPYKLKLDDEAPLFGLSPEKEWVLLANYIDETQLLNNIAFKTGAMLNMPYTNHYIPVELILNGVYKGLYLFTEQVEAGADRVDIGDDGVLLEMDAYYDEDWEFKSNNYQLPVMVKDPDLDDSSELTPIQNQFQQMEDLVASNDFPNNNYLGYIDDTSLVNDLIVFMLADNEEINYPKSFYLYKKATGKYMMGPVWDFDWAYGYNDGMQKHFTIYNIFFWQNSLPGTNFFTRLLSDPVVAGLLKQKWAAFVNENSDSLQQFVDDYAFIIAGARNRDYPLWKRGNVNYQSDISDLKAWLLNRIDYLNGYINGL